VRALVTGGAGFIGSTLVDRLLAEGHAVDVVDDLSKGRLVNLADARADRSAELKIHQVDIRSPEMAELVARREPEVVYHLAAAFDRDPAADAVVNIVGSLYVLEGARMAGSRKVVFAAGASVYGEPDPDVMPVRESHPHKPVSAHGVAKKVVVDYLQLYRERHDLEFTALALATVYGPRQASTGGVVGAFAEALLHGLPVVVRGDGSQTRDFVYVDDVVDAFVRAADRGAGLLINVGRGVQTSVRHVLATMAEAAGVDDVSPKHADRAPGEVDRMALDPSRAKIHLGWEPWTSLEEGIAQVLEARAARPA